MTSYKSLYYDGRECDRWNRLHPQDGPRRPYVQQVLDGESGPVVAALDYVGAVGLSIAPWVTQGTSEDALTLTLSQRERGRTNSPRPLAGEGQTERSPLPLGEGQGVRAAGSAPSTISSYAVLGADGFGRSEARQELRRFFEVDAENIALAALAELAREGKYPKEKLPAAIKTLGLDPEKPNPVTV